MHKFAVIHKHSNTVCYSANRVAHCVAPNNNYEIVSLDSSNAGKFNTVAYNLTFSDYSEIVAALNGDFIGFYVDADDNLFISNQFRTINIPALLFQESCLEIEEVAFDSVCELVGDNEQEAYQAIQLWVASRLLSTDTDTTDTDTTDTDTTDTDTTDTDTTDTDTTEMSTEMSNVFKKPTTLPITINFTHSVSKSHEYAGCPRVVAECVELGFYADQVGYGYDMVAALMSDFINTQCNQYAIQCAYAFNELREGYNFIHAYQSGKFYINAGCLDDAASFFHDVGLSIKFTRSKHGEIVSAVIYK